MNKYHPDAIRSHQVVLEQKLKSFWKAWLRFDSDPISGFGIPFRLSAFFQSISTAPISAKEYLSMFSAESRTSALREIWYENTSGFKDRKYSTEEPEAEMMSRISDWYSNGFSPLVDPNRPRAFAIFSDRKISARFSIFWVFQFSIYSKISATSLVSQVGRALLMKTCLICIRWILDSFSIRLLNRNVPNYWKWRH